MSHQKQNFLWLEVVERKEAKGEVRKKKNMIKSHKLVLTLKMKVARIRGCLLGVENHPHLTINKDKEPQSNNYLELKSANILNVFEADTTPELPKNNAVLLMSGW